MSYTTIIGFLLLAISAVIFYVTNLDFSGLFFEREFLVGITGGAGIGFLLGGFLGWLYRVRAEKKKNAQMVEEQKQKIAEQKAQELFAKEQSSFSSSYAKEQSSLSNDKTTQE